MQFRRSPNTQKLYKVQYRFSLPKSGIEHNSQDPVSQILAHRQELC